MCQYFLILVNKEGQCDPQKPQSPPLPFGHAVFKHKVHKKWVSAHFPLLLDQELHAFAMILHPYLVL